MSLKNKINHILSKYNPLAVRRRSNLRKALVNHTVTFLCPNCIGGLLFHDLGLQFRSPTINLMMFQPHFVKFVHNIKYYLSKDFSPYIDPEFPVPCAHLEDIDIHFTHYATVEEGIRKWNERAKRIDWDNIFIFLTERDGLTYEEIKSLSHLKVRGILVFTAHDYPDIPYALQIPKYTADGEVGNILRKSRIDDRKEYENYFDFVKWFNEANGGSYDISPYIKDFT